MSSAGVITPQAGRRSPQKTYSLPVEVVVAIEHLWAFHRTLDGRLAASRSEYLADLVRRDVARRAVTPLESEALAELVEHAFDVEPRR